MHALRAHQRIAAARPPRPGARAPPPAAAAVGAVSAARRPIARPVAAAAADTAAEASSSSSGGSDSGSGGGAVEPLSGLAADAAALVAPAARAQPRLSGKEVSALRAQAEDMVREKKMVIVQVGANGINPAVLASMMDVLQKRSFVRVRCGASGGERKELARQLARLLDAEVVHQIGFTVTLYRAPGLPRPTGCDCSGGKGGGGGSGLSAAEE
ncbi:hypothetical protein Rsub_11717 [Raphidocelis subcapitata]|uniref:CRM domain-containing protein n=1 Tax=Raphidocelis subcapitata TaxID=307507 RepID=A0A2V0PP26_9CHLO|nr:hypothetical protein Rsub_11717 [Raphidocelis subcapitata]|eukprot:GBF98925.1 hypothetical protein Rsub_11717 [Raphidocelis subcapitata]